MAKPTVSEHFWSKVAAPDENGCRLWTAGRGDRGYGKFSTGGRTYRAHRFAYELVEGPVPTGLVLDHKCRVILCVNPEHLEPVTHQENVRRGARANQTHCKNGHEFTPENTYVRKNGWRYCRTCRRGWSKEARDRKHNSAHPE